MGTRGASPGERRGGRTAGTKNRSTVERELVAAQQVADAKASGRKLAKEVLQEFMHQFRVRAFKARNNDNFERWARLAVETARWLAPYESPQFARIEVPSPPPTIDGEPQRMRFSLRVFEGGRPVSAAGDDDYRPHVSERGAS
jgi:hypothetical protein